MAHNPSKPDNKTIDAVVDFPDHQLVELMTSPDVRNRKMAEQFGREQRGWKKSDWAMPMLAAFDVSISHNGSHLFFTLHLGTSKVVYTAVACWYQKNDFHNETCYFSVTRVWTINGQPKIKSGIFGGYRNIYQPKKYGANVRCSAESLADAIQHDWVGFWNANFKTTKCMLA